MKYIKDNILDLGTKESKIYHNLNTIFHYIYHQIHLDENKTKKLYKHIKVDYISDSYFVPSKIKDKKYYYGVTKFDKLYFINPDNDFNKKLLKELGKYLDKNSPKDLLLKNVHKIKLINNNGVNDDTRGTSDLDWKLHFWDEFIIHKNHQLSFHDLILAAFKIKSHKFDSWYELFSNVNEEDFFVLHNSSSVEKWIEITAVIEFDHGS
ncbi:hypothetical protein [Moumouvirus maliensis]|nr:hypothetical protein [Moumouvirus maliensis]